MARRKRDLANKLDSNSNSEIRRPGWRDTIAPSGETAVSPPSPPAAAENPDALKRKTYLLTEEIIGQIEDLADAERVGISELVRFLLVEAMAQIEEGILEVPTKPGKRQIR
ncbi:MAG TPA: hypothetical protein VLL52_24640 [Anaerolineae bacterium]|nr:hypothetical protein [Anaerolineae bacterium]